MKSQLYLRSFILISFLIITGCVSQKKYDEAITVNEQYELEKSKLVSANRELLVENEMLSQELISAKDKVEYIERVYEESLKNNSKPPKTDTVYLNIEEFEYVNEELKSKISEVREMNHFNELLIEEHNLATENLKNINTKLDSIKENTFDGELLVNCPSEMIEGREYNILAVVNKVLQKEQIIESISKAQKIDINTATTNSTVLNVTLSNKVRISIHFDKEDFELISDTRVYERKLGKRAEWFPWTIKALRPGENKKLTFTLENLVHEGEWQNYLPPQEFLITVDVNKSNFITNTYILANENPEWAFSALIIPLLSFLAGLYTKNRNGKKKLPDTA